MTESFEHKAEIKKHTLSILYWCNYNKVIIVKSNTEIKQILHKLIAQLGNATQIQLEGNYYIFNTTTWSTQQDL